MEARLQSALKLVRKQRKQYDHLARGEAYATYQFTCGVCSHTFDTFDELKEHIHDKPKPKPKQKPVDDVLDMDTDFGELLL